MFGYIHGVNGGEVCASFYLWCFQCVLAAWLDFPLRSRKIKVMEIIPQLG